MLNLNIYIYINTYIHICRYVYIYIIFYYISLCFSAQPDKRHICTDMCLACCHSLSWCWQHPEGDATKGHIPAAREFRLRLCIPKALQKLGDTAKLLETMYGHMKVCTGVLKGVKTRRAPLWRDVLCHVTFPSGSDGC